MTPRPTPRPTRRAFQLGAAALAAQSAWPLVRAPRPEVVRLGVIGPGKRGLTLMRGAFLQEPFQITALCEVDGNRLAGAAKLVSERQGTEPFTTSRHEELLARDDIDAVVIATPDHWHAHQILDAAAAGKHIYCEKPLTLTLHEAKVVIPAVRKAGVVFQTGSQQRTEFGQKFVDACELVRNGRIGEVLTVHVGVGDPARACDLPVEALEPGLDWERWLGPAPQRAYHSELAPRGVHNHYPAWRRYWEYAGGGLSDMGAHHFDIGMWGLRKDGEGPIEVHPPIDSSATRGASVVFADGVRMIHGGPSGTTFIGTRGTIAVDRGRISSTPGNLLTDPLPDDAERLPRHANHAADWLQALRGEGETTCPIEVGAGSVAICNLLNLAYRHRRSLRWDPRAWRFVDDDEANGWLDYERRDGYALPVH